MSYLARIWCRLTLRHRGQVDYILGVGAFWMCDHCGAIDLHREDSPPGLPTTPGVGNPGV